MYNICVYTCNNGRNTDTNQASARWFNSNYRLSFLQIRSSGHTARKRQTNFDECLEMWCKEGEETDRDRIDEEFSKSFYFIRVFAMRFEKFPRILQDIVDLIFHFRDDVISEGKCSAPSRRKKKPSWIRFQNLFSLVEGSFNAKRDCWWSLKRCCFPKKEKKKKKRKDK